MIDGEIEEFVIDGIDRENCDRFLSRGICDRLLEKEFVIDGEIEGFVIDGRDGEICDRWQRWRNL